MRTWEEMRSSIAKRLVRQTGHDVAWWNARLAERDDVGDEPSLRRVPAESGVTGYQQMLLVMERSDSTASSLRGACSMGETRPAAGSTCGLRSRGSTISTTKPPSCCAGLTGPISEAPRSPRRVARP